MTSNLAVVVITAGALAAGAAQAQVTGHTMITAPEIKWGPAPASLPAGAQAAVLYGDPGKDGPFVLRLKLPKGYRIPAHSHARPEIVTVVSGTFKLGTGPGGERETARALPAGSFFAFEPGMTHYAYTDEETVVQLNSSGPWAINYVNPKDDPRQKAAQ